MIDKIAAILDHRAFLLYPWENPESEYYGAAYVTRYTHPSAIAKRRKAALKKAVLIMELFQTNGDL